MKFKLVYTAFLLCMGFVLLTSSKFGRASADNPEGNTGAPGDVAMNGRTCLNCHNTGSIQVTLDIEVSDENGSLVSAYIPGETYSVKVRLNTFAGSPSAFGFQLVSEFDSNHTTTNSWSNPSSNAKIVGLGGRDYAEHVSPSPTNEFTVDWTAPATGSGSITFYSGGNGVNGNNMSSGDGAAIKSLTLTESTTSTFFAPNPIEDIRIYPNPVADWLQLQLKSGTSTELELRLFDVEGKQVLQQVVSTLDGRLAQPVHLAHLPEGLYFLQLNEGSKVLGGGKVLKK
ncbi:MAG: T9SS type A sorting domain-containing protein [Phaeodactylibacter sp.]|nr:T9SS type A sorting domain-containing protein [Phaeodactylibacter sp.]